MWPFSSAYPERSIDDVAGKTYDYIIVGGGTAGCVLAARLSEDPTVSVLLVERGPRVDTYLSRIPMLSLDYRSPLVPGVLDRYSEAVDALRGRRVHLPNAEALGGTTRVNGMLVTRSVPGGYNGWAEEGLPDWRWEVVEPYFKKFENAVAHPDAPYRGHDGPLEIKQIGMHFTWMSHMAKACAQIGLPVSDDCNNPDGPAQGFFTLDQAIGKNGQRLATDRAYLGARVARERQAHLSICTGVVATKVQIDIAGQEKARRATGVYIAPAVLPANVDTRAPPSPVLVSARREVIVCGGAFRSPQLLLLSGIGPRAQFEDNSNNSNGQGGTACVHDLPHVGAHLADHFAMPIMVDLPVQETYQRLRSILYALYTLLLYVVFGQGLLSCSTAATVFTRLDTIDDQTMDVQEEAGQGLDAYQAHSVPDLELMLLPINVLAMDLAARSRLTLFTTLTQSHLSGRVTLASSTDPRVHPRITYPLLADPRDRVLLRKAARFAMRLADEFATNTGYPGAAAALTVAPGMDPDDMVAVTGSVSAGSLGRQRPDGGAESTTETSSSDDTASVQSAGTTDAAAKPVAIVPPPPTDHKKNKNQEDLPSLHGRWATVTDAEIDAYAERTLLSSLHYGCSCRMSPDASTGVVDTSLRVHGIANLRVADASVFPRIPSAHTMAATLMVAERCADFVKEGGRNSHKEQQEGSCVEGT